VALLLAVALSVSPLQAASKFRRGDIDGDGIINITDAVSTLGHLFLGRPATIPCRDAADSNDDGVVAINDPIYLLNYLFLGGAAPAPPFPDCGADPSADDLDCESFKTCVQNDVLGATAASGGTGEDRASGVVIDAEGGALLAGSFQEQLRAAVAEGAGAGAETLAAAGGSDILVVRHDVSGAALWAVAAGGPLDDAASALALTSSGDVAVTGFFANTATFGGRRAGPPEPPGDSPVTLQSEPIVAPPEPPNRDGFVALYDPHGALRWARRIGGARADAGLEVAAAHDGTIWAAGTYRDVAVFESGEAPEIQRSSLGESDIFLARYDGDGHALLVIDARSPGEARLGELFLTRDGEVLIGGVFREEIVLGGGTPSETRLTDTSGDEAVFVALYGPEGDFLRGRQIARGEQIELSGLWLDPTGLLTVGGNLLGAGLVGSFADPDADPAAGSWRELVFTAGRGGFVARLEEDDTPLWLATLSASPGGNSIRDLVLNATENVVVTGVFHAPATLAGDTGEPFTLSEPGPDAAPPDGFLAWITPEGAVGYATTYGGPGRDESSALGLGPDGAIGVAGSFEDSASFGEGESELTSEGESDAFAATFFPPNTVPVALDDAASTPEDTSTLVDVLLNDSDPDGNPLRISSVTAPADGDVEIIADGARLRYTPREDFNGADALEYEIDDGFGGVATARLALTVESVNDDPVAARDVASTELESAVTIDVLANDRDPDGDPLSVVAVSAAGNGTAELAGGAVLYTPGAEFQGVDSFLYTVSDGQGGEAAAAVTISVLAADNTAPTARDVTLETDEDTPLLLSAAFLASDDDGDPLSVHELGPPAHGTALLSGGLIRYLGAPDFHGEDAFAYTVADGRGGLASGRVTVQVLSVNDLPVAREDSATTTELASISVAVLRNDTDADGDALQITAVGEAADGTTARGAGDRILYTPRVGFHGEDAFEYTVSDPSGASATARVSVLVEAENRPPVALDDSAETTRDTAVTILVTANDSDPNGDALQVTAVSDATNGSALLAGAGAVLYEPDPDFTGADAFEYTVSDGRGGTASASVSVTVLDGEPPEPVVGLDGTLFAPLDEEGRARFDQALTPGADGALPPFLYRPGGVSLAEFGGGVLVRFPQGARLVSTAAGEALLAASFAVEFSDEFPLALTDELSHDGASRSFPLGALQLQDLLPLLGEDPGAGLAVRLYDTIDLVWKSGRIDRDGIHDAKFEPTQAGLPLPVPPGAYSDLTLTFSRSEGVSIPFHGTFILPDGSSDPPSLVVPPFAPLWLRVRPDGSMGLSGRAVMRFAAGSELEVDVRLDDPLYRLEIVAKGLGTQNLLPMKSALPPATACVPPSAEIVGELDRAQRCLEAVGDAYGLFARSVLAGAVSSGAAGAGVAVPPGGAVEPPSATDLSIVLLRAWTRVIVGGAAGALPEKVIAALYTRIGTAAASRDDPAGVARYLLELEDARTAWNEAGEPPPSLVEAIETADKALSERLGRLGNDTSLRSFRDLTQLLVRIHEVRLELGEEDSLDHLKGGVRNFVDGFGARLINELDVKAKVFLPAKGSPIASLGRAAAFDRARFVHELYELAAVFDVEDAYDALPFSEALGQLASRIFGLTVAAFEEAEARSDYFAAQIALADLIDLIAMVDLAIFPGDKPELDGLPDIAALKGPGGYVARLGEILEAEFARPHTERTYNDLAHQVEVLVRILEALPPEVDFLSKPFADAAGALGETLLAAAAKGQLALEDRPRDLVSLLRGFELKWRYEGRVAARDGDDVVNRIFNRPAVERVVDRLVVLGGERKDWQRLSGGVQALLRAAAFAGEEERHEDRLFLFQQAAELLEEMLTVVCEILDEQPPAAGGAPASGADLLLFGGFRIHDAAGSLSFDRDSGHVEGSFRGELELPGLGGARLSVPGASFSSGGAFDLTAHGSVTVSGVNLSIPARRPLVVSYRHPGPPTLSGGVRVELSNGVSFEAFAGFDEEAYRFGILAEGLRFELAEELKLLLPAIDWGATASLGRQSASVLADYYRSMSGTLELLAGDVPELPPLPDPTTFGKPPVFETPALTGSFDALETLINAPLAHIELQSNVNFANTANVGKAAMKTLADGLKVLRGKSETLRAVLRSGVLLHQLRRLLEEQKTVDNGLLWLYENGQDGPLTREVYELLAEARRLRVDLATPANAEDTALVACLLREILDFDATSQQLGLAEGDRDYDHRDNDLDNCPGTPNRNQVDRDEDGIGDACDLCPDFVDGERARNRDLDGDGLGDACDPDDDGDGEPDESDICPRVFNVELGGVDADDDGVPDSCDNCRDTPNEDQNDTDLDGLGDVCDEPGSPDTPCARLETLRAQGASTTDIATAFFECSLARYLEANGFDPRTAAVADQELFDSFEAGRLEELLFGLLDLWSSAVVLGAEDFDAVPAVALTAVTDKLKFKYREELDSPKIKAVRAYELLARLQGLHEFKELLTNTTETESFLQQEADYVAFLLGVLDTRQITAIEKRVARDRERVRKRNSFECQWWLDDPEADDRILSAVKALTPKGVFRFASDLVAEDSEVFSPAAQNLAEKAEAILLDLEEDTIPSLGADGLGVAVEVLDQLVDMALWAQAVQADGTLERIGEVSIPQLTVKLKGVAEAQKAWWFLSRYSDALLDVARLEVLGAPIAIEASLEIAATDTLEAWNGLVDALVEAGSPLSLEDFTFKLPGDMKIRRVFGEVTWFRQSQIFEGKVGGRVEFPAIDAFFEIREGLFRSDLSFEIDASTGGPIPFIDGYELEGRIEVSGSFTDLSQVTFAGNGALRLPTGLEIAVDESLVGGAGAGDKAGGEGDPAATPYPIPEGAWPVLIDWNGSTLEFGWSGNNLRVNVDDLMFLLDAGFEVSFTPDGPKGVLGVNAQVGFWKKDPAPDVDDWTQHYLFHVKGATEGTQARGQFAFESDEAGNIGFDLSLLSGRAGLDPAVFGEWSNEVDCDWVKGDPPVTGPYIEIGAAQPLVIHVELGADDDGVPLIQDVGIAGALTFGGLGVTLPGLEEGGVSVGLCTATLDFDVPEGQLIPHLSNVNGYLEIDLPDGQKKLPDEQKKLEVRLENAGWKLGGLPTGRIALGQDLTFFEAGGFSLTLIGADNSACTFEPGCLGEQTQGTGLSICETGNGTLRLDIDGGARFAAPSDLVWNDDPDSGGEVGATVCARISIDPFVDPLNPRVEVYGLEIRGDFRIGGSAGLLFAGASLTAVNIQSLLGGGDEPFQLCLNGTVQLPGEGPGFGVTNACFQFDPLRFTIEGAELITGGAGVALVDGLPMQVESIGIRFLCSESPEGCDELSVKEYLDPSNIELLLSGRISLPPDNPVVTGAVQNVKMRLDENGNPQIAELSGIGMGINDLTIPPLVLGGEVYIGGLTDLPDGLFFAGKVEGKYQGTGVGAQIAFNLDGLIALCLDVDLGGAGIPLGYGFVLSGVEGGMALDPRFDPCDILSTLPIGDDGRPNDGAEAGEGGGAAAPASPPVLISWEELARANEMAKANELLRQATGVAERGRPKDADRDPLLDLFEIELPTIDARADGGFEGGGAGGIEDPVEPPCPPPVVDILCQRHPDDPDRVIYKFSNIPPEVVDTLLEFAGISIEALESATPEAAGELARALAIAFGDWLLDAWFIDPADPDGPDDVGFIEIDLAREIGLDIIAEGVVDLGVDAFEAAVEAAIQAALGPDNESVYDALIAAAWHGIPCAELKLVVAGSFSYTGVSNFASLTGRITLATGPQVGLGGSIDVWGIPVAEAQGFYSVTDNEGDLNPSLCATVDAGLGPFELGQMRAGYTCDGCYSGLFAALGNFAVCLVDADPGTLDAVAEILRRTATGELREELDSLTSADLRLRTLALFEDSELTEDQVMSFFADFLSQQTGALAGDFLDCVAELFTGALESMNPEIYLRGNVTPKFFGIPLATDLVAFDLLANKTTFTANFGYSPSGLLSMAVRVPIFPPIDFASVGYNLEVADFDDAAELFLGGVRGEMTPAEVARLAETRLLEAFEKATYTFEYEVELAPLGMKMAESSGRFLMPDLTNHPRARQPGDPWLRPELRDLPTRVEILQALTAAQLLGDARWKGDKFSLIEGAYEFDDPDMLGRLAGRDLISDFFPYGGVVGAGILRLPNLLAERFPPEVGTVLDGEADPFARLSAAQVVIGHIFSTTDIGTMSYHFPAPNPPVFEIDDGDGGTRPATRKELIETLLAFDFETFQTALEAGTDEVDDLLSIGEAFFEGRVAPRLFGIELARGSLVVREGRFEYSGFLRGVGQGAGGGGAGGPISWINGFVAPGSLGSSTVDLAIDSRNQDEAPAEALEDAFSSIQERLSDLASRVEGGEEPNVEIEAALRDLRDEIFTSLPRASFEATLEGFRFPAPLDTLVGIEGDVSAGLFAYSPMYDWDENATPMTPLEKARNVGGVVISASVSGENGSGGLLVGPPGLPRLAIENPTLELALLFDPDSVIPDIEGSITADSATLGGLSLEGIAFEISSDPAPGEPILRGDATLAGSSLDPNGALALTPLDGDGDGIRVSIELLAGEEGEAPRFDVTIDPAQIELTSRVIGGSIVARLHGAGGLEERFGFSTTDPWSIAVEIEGKVEIVDPLTRQTMLSILLPTQTGALSGAGLESWMLDVSIPADVECILFPRRGAPLETSFAVSGGAGRLSVDSSGNLDVELAGPELVFPNHFRLGGGTARLVRDDMSVIARLEGPQLTIFSDAPFENDPIALGAGVVEIDSNGRFVYDSGEQTVGLPGTFIASGQLQFGYLPSGAADGDLFLPRRIFEFGQIRVGEGRQISIEVINRGRRSIAVTAESTRPTRFRLKPSTFHLAAGASRFVEVDFVPDAAGRAAAEVFFSDGASSQIVRVSGTGVGLGGIVLDRDQIDFGSLTRGRSGREELVLTSVGSEALEIRDIQVPRGFRVTLDGVRPRTPFPIDPLETRVLDIDATPEALGVFGGDLVLETSIGRQVVTLRASGSTPQWFVSFADFLGIRDGYFRGANGWFVGRRGLLVSTLDEGRTWSRLRVPGDPDLSCIAVDDRGAQVWVIAEDGTLFRNAGTSFTPFTSAVLSGRTFRDVAVHRQGETGSPAAAGTPSFATLVGDGGVILRQVSENDFRSVGLRGRNPPDLHAVAFRGEDGLAVGDAGTMLRSQGANGAWTPIELPVGGGAGGTAPDLRDVAIDSDGRFLAVGRGGYVLRGSLGVRNGEGAEPFVLSTHPLLDGVDLETVAIAGQTAWTAGVRTSRGASEPVVLRTVDGGVNWQEDRLLGDTGFVAAPRALGVFTSKTGVHAMLADDSGKILVRVPYGAERILLTSPPELSFPAQSESARQVRVVTVENRGTEPLRARPSIIGSTDFTISPQTEVEIAPGARVFFEVAYTPLGAGSDEARVVFVSNDSSGLAGPSGPGQIRLSGSAFANVWEEFRGGSDAGEQLTSLAFADDNQGWAIGRSTGLSRTIDGGSSWQHQLDGRFGVVAFSGGKLCVLGDNGVNYRSTDDGQTWSQGPSPTTSDFRDLAMLDSKRWLAVAVAPNGRPSEIWRTLDGAESWAETGAPDGFRGGVIDATSDGKGRFTFLTFSGRTVYASYNTGAAWDPVFTATGTDLRHLSIGGEPGQWRAAICGSRGYFATSTDALTWQVRSLPNTGLDVRHVHVLDANPNRAWVIAKDGDEYTIWRTKDAGVSWRSVFTAPSGAVLTAIDARSKNLVWAAGSRAGLPKVWRLSVGVPRPQAIASAPLEISCGETGPGEVVTRTVTIDNPGRRRLAIDNVVLQGDAFSLVGAVPTSIPPGGRAELSVEMRAGRGALLRGGAVLGALRLFTNGDLGRVGVRLCGRVRKPTDSLTITTEPPGLPIRVAGTTYRTPAVIHDLRAGDRVVLVSDVVETDLASRCDLAWVSRSDGGAIGDDYVFNGGIRRLDVLYAPINCGDTSPEGVCAIADLSELPAGPFLRLCDATLSVPWLGGLNVSGELLLSATRIHALLQSGELSLPQESGVLGARGSFFEASAASFSFDYEGDGQGGLTRLEVRAESPSVSVFGKGVTPESRATFSYGADGALEGSVSIDGVLPLLHGIFELTPRSGQSTMDLSFSNESLSLDARLQALKLPTDGWAIEQDVDFHFEIGDFEYGIAKEDLPDTTLLDLGAVKLVVVDPNPPAENAVFLARENGVLSVGLRGIEAKLLGKRLLTIEEAVADSSGVLRFTAEAGPEETGETFTARPVSMTTTKGGSGSWNVLTGAFEVTIPGFTVSVDNVGWPEAGLSFPPLTLSSEEAFKESSRLGLGVLELAGIDLSDFQEGEQTDDENYVELRFAENGVPHVEVRASLEFFTDTFDLSLDAAGNGEAKMWMESRGQVSLQPLHDACMSLNGVLCPLLPDVLEAVATLDYDSDDPDNSVWPFSGTVSVTKESSEEGEEQQGLLSIGLKFGPSGGQLCWDPPPVPIFGDPKEICTP